MSLYQKLAELQGTRPWGSVLDAGTGRSSIRWLMSLQTERWTAVTGSERMAEVVRKEIGERLRPQDRLAVGNWTDVDLLAGESYDTVLADYLLGAIDGFAPYWQDCLFRRLKPLIGRRLYIIGLEPYVPYVPDDSAGRIVVDVHRVPIRYGERFVNSQLDLCAQSLGRMRNRNLAVALQAHIGELRSRALARASLEGGLRHGHDYIVVAEP